jgi:hypothetical protein
MKLLDGMYLALSGALLSGCAAHHQPSAGHAQTPAIVTADDSRVATVAMVNPVGQFVVLTFPTTQVPPNGRVLFLYRDGLKAGEVKITGPQRDANLVAELVSGEARVGDEVRNE